MRPGMDSNLPTYSQLRLVRASFLLGGLLSVAATGCQSIRPGQTVMEEQASTFCVSDSCGINDPTGGYVSSEIVGDNYVVSGQRDAYSDNRDTRCEQCDYEVPRELKKVSLPDYIVEPPDILLIEVSGGQKLPDAQLRPGEALHVRVANTLPVDTFDDPVSQAFKQIDNTYRIQPDGTLNFGPEYGSVPVRGLTIPEARRLIELSLKKTLRDPMVYLTRATDQADQPISGEHLVRPDGTVSLGIYGSVYVSGSSLSSARQAIERHLADHLNQPQVYVDVLAYNSKVFYIVTDGGGAGEQVFRFPCTGNETVLDALSQINGLPTVASKKDIWIARPAPPEVGFEQVLRVDWDGIVRGGQAKTNYQLLPGDRLYVQANRLVTFDTAIARITAPLERIAGFVLLGNGTVRALQRGRNAQGGVGF